MVISKSRLVIIITYGIVFGNLFENYDNNKFWDHETSIRRGAFRRVSAESF